MQEKNLPVWKALTSLLHWMTGRVLSRSWACTSIRSSTHVTPNSSSLARSASILSLLSDGMVFLTNSFTGCILACVSAEWATSHLSGMKKVNNTQQVFPHFGRWTNQKHAHQLHKVLAQEPSWQFSPLAISILHCRHLEFCHALKQARISKAICFGSTWPPSSAPLMLIAFGLLLFSPGNDFSLLLRTSQLNHFSFLITAST